MRSGQYKSRMLMFVHAKIRVRIAKRDEINEKLENKVFVSLRASAFMSLTFQSEFHPLLTTPHSHKYRFLTFLNLVIDRRAFYSSCPLLIHNATDLKHDLPQHFRKQLQFNLIKSTLSVHFY